MAKERKNYQLVGNKPKGQISKRMFQENKACQIFRKTNISYPLIRTRTYVYQGVRNVRFRKIWLTLLPQNIGFEIHPFGFLPMNSQGLQFSASHGRIEQKQLTAKYCTLPWLQVQKQSFTGVIKNVLENFAKFTGKHMSFLTRKVFLNKVLTCDLYLKKTLTQAFFYEFCEILQNSFFVEFSGPLLMRVDKYLLGSKSFIWVKVFKDGISKICGRQPL